MLKKLIYLLPFCFVVSAVAAPSVGLLGKTTPSANITKPATVVQKKQPVIKTTSARVAQDLKTSNLKADVSDASARIPMKKLINKTPTVTNTTTTNTTNTNTNVNHVSGGVSDSAYNSLAQRIEVLELKSANAITDVVENGSGAYVNDVKMNGNELSVKKTNLLYAPVKNASGQTLSGNAEIWIIK